MIWGANTRATLDAILIPDWYESLRKASNTYHTGELAVGNSKIENEKKKVVVFGVFDHQISRKREKKLPDLHIRFQ